MATTENLATDKNALWDQYRTAYPLIRAGIILDLKKQNLYRHWQQVASKQGYDLHMAKAPLRDIFIKHMPESATHFGITISSN